MSKNLNSRKITYVKLHGSDAFVPGIGGLGTTLPPTNKTLDLKMSHTEAGVFMSINKGRVEVTIPWANVQLALYGPEEAPAAELKSA